MWVLQQPGPGVFDTLEVDTPTAADVQEAELLVRFSAGAICGSDIPKFHGHIDPQNPYTGLPGVPLHELVGYVEASKSERFVPGDRVVGIVAKSRGLQEYLVNPADLMFKVDDRLSDIHATMVQPLASVFSALDRVPNYEGRTVAAIGLGPLGILFTHLLKSRGAKKVIGVDRVDRSDVAKEFGVDELVVGDSSTWAASLSGGDDRPVLVVDAVGHQQEILVDAVTALERHGHLLVFGLPEEHYAFPIRTFFRKDLSLNAGVTHEWVRFLDEAQEYVLNCNGLPDSYITHVLSVTEAESAFNLYSRPAIGRLKVALTAP